MEAVRGTASGLVLAVGSSGVVLRSVDSGATWSSLKTGSSKWLYGLAISAADRCIAVGESGTLLVSSDRGVSWAQRDSRTSGTLLAVDWLTNSIAIAAGQSGVLVKTTDAGLSWALLPSGITAQLESIQFLTDSLGFACGLGYVFETRDAGTTWIQHPAAPTSYDWISTLARFANAKVGFMISWYKDVWRTTDGGNSWVKIASSLSSYLTGIACIDTATAIIVGQDASYRLTGGGTLTAIDNATMHNMLDVSFVTPTRGFAVGSQGKILRTTDAGLTWNDPTVGIHQNLTDVSFWSESSGVIVGGEPIYDITSPGQVIAGEPNAYYTSDGGRTWTTKATPAVFNCVDFLDSLREFATGVATGGSGYAGYADVWRTKDGGANWDLVHYDGNFTSHFSSIGGWDTLRGCAIGDYYHEMGSYGIITSFTFDGGGFWLQSAISSINPEAYPHMYSLSIVDSVTGYAILTATHALTGAQYSLLLRTTDAGRTWSAQSANIPSSTIAVQFVDHMTGTLTVKGGVIMRSEDGGLTWGRQESPTSNDLASVCFGTPTAGVTVGANGTLISTTDGGRHWQIEPAVTSATLSKVFVSQGGNVIAIGSSGAIIRGHISPNPQSSMNGGISSFAKNYPNPFSVTTTIPFTIDQPGLVTLKVFLLGREVATLVHEEMVIGQYQRLFDGTKLPSGVYLVRLQSGGRMAASKLMLLK